MYTIGIAFQTKVFLLSLGLGFILGVLYDVFRIVRLIVSAGKKAAVVQDILYVLFVTFFTFIFMLVVNEGRLRFYALLGQTLGFFVYYFAFGAVAIAFAQRAVVVSRGALKLFSRIVSAPFRALFSLFSKLFGFLHSFFRKKLNIFRKNLKMYLKKLSGMMYNLICKTGD